MARLDAIGITKLKTYLKLKTEMKERKKILMIDLKISFLIWRM